MSTQPRRTSFGMLLRRSKSGDLGKGSKKQQALREQELQRQRDAIPKAPPQLPALYNGAPAPQLQTFGGDSQPDAPAPAPTGRPDRHYPSSARPSMEPGRSVASVPVPPAPGAGWVDPYARTESMTNRGRYSYASSAISTINSPRRVRRRKDPTPFNILIVGTRGAGKTSFLEFLKNALALPPRKRTKGGADHDDFAPRTPASGNFIPHYVESEIDGERVGLTLWDSEGLEKNVVDLQLREMAAFLESKFEETFNEEMKVMRSPGVQDTHIHAVFMILDPARLDRNLLAARALAANGHSAGAKYHPHARVIGSLDEDLDLQVLRTLQGKTIVIPVISKADTITTKHMAVLKKTVWDSLKKANLDPLEALGLDDEDAASNSGRIDEADEDAIEDSDTGDDAAATGDDDDLPIQGSESPATSRFSKRLSGQSGAAAAKDEEGPFIPMSIISPDIYEPGVVGRQFPWGFADPYNDEHCDFLRLKDAVFTEWRGELREASREQWYENWRTSRLKQRDGVSRRR